jgi:hypothetical protein
MSIDNGKYDRGIQCHWWPVQCGMLTNKCKDSRRTLKCDQDVVHLIHSPSISDVRPLSHSYDLFVTCHVSDEKANWLLQLCLMIMSSTSIPHRDQSKIKRTEHSRWNLHETHFLHCRHLSRSERKTGRAHWPRWRSCGVDSLANKKHVVANRRYQN